MKNSLLWLCFTISLLFTSVSANAISRDQALRELDKLGFENLKVHQEGNTTYLTAEDNVYRGLYRGIGTICRTLSPTPAADTIVLVVLQHQMPRLTVHAIHNEADQWDVTAEYGADSKAMRKLWLERQSQSSLGKVDFVVHPQLMLDSLFHDNNHRYAVNIAPAIEMSLWPGAKLTAQVIIPIINNIDTDPTYDKIRPGIMTLSQNFVLNRWFELTATAGIFHTNQSIYADTRQGFDLQLTSHLTSKLDVGINAGYTGTFCLDGSAWHFERPDQLNILGHVGYYEPRINSQLDIYAGQFVYGDAGVRADFTRRLGEYAVGFFGTYAEKETAIGFYCSIPLGPKKQMRHGAVRISLPESMCWDYSMPNYSKPFSKKRLGVTYNTTTAGRYSNDFWQPEYVAKYVGKFLRGEIE